MQDPGGLEPGNAGDDAVLDMARQARRNPVRIDGVIVQTLGFEEDLVRLALGEPLYLILDRRAVARALPGNLAAIDGRKMNRLGNDPVRFGRRAGDSAFDLGHRNALCHARERHRRVVGRLLFEPVPVDCPAIETRRSAGFQPSDRQVEGPKSLGEHVRRRLADPAGGRDFLAKMNQAAEKGSGGQHHRAGTMAGAGLVDDAAADTVLDQKIANRGFDDPDTAFRDKRLNGLAIEFAVGLRPRAVNGRATRPVEHAELDA